eukprot:IDg11584t1
MKIAWISNSRPDYLISINQLAQVTEAMFLANKTDQIKKLNTAVRYAVRNLGGLSFPKLDIDTLHVVGYSDASFASNGDLSPQLGHITLLRGASGSTIPFALKSYKAGRVTRSVLAAEVIAFSDMFDVAFTICAELEYIIGCDILLQLLTDSKCLFETISKSYRTSEKRLMLDFAVSREGYCKKEILDISSVRSSQNIAYGLTQKMGQAALRD